MKTFVLFALCAVLFGCESTAEDLRFENTECEHNWQVIDNASCEAPTACCGDVSNLDLEDLCSLIYPDKPIPWLCQQSVDVEECVVTYALVTCDQGTHALVCCAPPDFL